MTSRRSVNRAAAVPALGLALALWASAQTASGACANCPTVELERQDKTIVAVKTSPDDVSDVFVIEYLDLQTGRLEALDPVASLASVAGVKLWYDARSQVDPKLKEGDFVQAVYNSDLGDAQGRAYLLELLPYPEQSPTHHALQRFLIYDPKPYRTEVHFGKNAAAYGHVAQVERVKGLRERVVLGDGKVTYQEQLDRYEVRFTDSDKAVEVVQGKSKAWGRRLDYDNETGEARVSGPIQLERSGEEPLSGTAETLVYNLDEDTLTLAGKVVLTQGERTTLADSAYVVESDGYAYLYGDPVVSRGADGEVRGKTVRYQLDTGELLVLEGVEAVFQDAP